MDTNTFLKTVLADTGYFCLFAANAVTDKRIQKFYASTESLLTDADDLNGKGFDVYFALATFEEEGSRKATNVKYLRSFFLDLDCGPSKDYATKIDAINALQGFCESLSLPVPITIDSGRGVHVYWPLSENIHPDDWEVAAEKLKKLCVLHGFFADPAVTADTARVLRVPDTHNYKTDPPSPVGYLSNEELEVNDFDVFSRLLGTEFVPPPTKAAPTGSNAVMDALLGNREASFIDIINKTKEGRGCKQLKLILKDQENTSEPMWRAGLSIARFCVDGKKASRTLSKRHPQYSEEETSRKFGPIKGPYTCAKFDELNPDICPDCPNWGKVKSPIVLGNRYKEADTSSQKKEKDIPMYPHPYFRGANGGVYIRSSNADGDIDEKCIYHNDIYVVQRVVDPEFGESVVMRLHLPQDGIREFTLPLTAVTSREEFRKMLSAQGVAVTKMDELMTYTTTWINELQANTVAKNAHRQFGWTDEKMDAFILGNQKVLSDSIEFNPPSNQTMGLFDAFEPKGTLEGWKELISFWDKEGLELYQYVLGAGFGSVLMQFFNANCAALHLHNLDSGVAKTTAAIAQLGIWGNPQKLILDKDDTHHSKMNRGELYHSLPLVIDEITNISPKEGSDLLYQFSSGKQRNRLTSSGNVERFRGNPWSNLALTTGNSSIIERVSMAKAMPRAEAQRVLECYVPNVKHLLGSIDDAYAFEEGVKAEQFGTAGIIFVQYVMNNLEEIRAMTKEMKSRVDRVGKLEQENRFWSAHISATMVGLIIAKRLGLISFNVKNIFKWVIEVLLPQNKRNTEISNVSVFDTMNNFFIEHISNILQIKSTQDNRSKVQNNGLDALVIPEAFARGKLVARYETDTQLFYVVPKILKSWCGELQINYSHLLKQITEHCEGRRAKVRLGKGTSLNLPPADVLVMKFAIDDNEELGDTTDL
tara:strand:- start:1231 stop:4026 length:2796 start_codon:yes stop_codon:yes gene_type:complete